MTYLYGRSAGGPMVAAAVGMRLFWGMAVDYPFPMNGAWLCPLLGLFIFLPIAFAIEQAEKLGTGSVWDNLNALNPGIIRHSVEIAFALVLLYDSAVAVRQLASSSNLIALNDITVHLLIFPLLFVIAAVILLGGDAAGNSARLWLRILPLFALIILVVQAGSYRVGWLTPLLGGGLNSILNGSIYCAGCLSIASLIWLIALPDRGKRGIWIYTVLPCTASSLLLATQHMSFPAMINIPFTRAARIELILSNGRMSLSPQLILDILWFGSFLHLISAEVTAASTYLHICFAKCPKWLLAIWVSVIVSLLAIFNPECMKDSSEVTRLLFLPIAGTLAVLMTSALLRKKVKKYEKI